MSALLLGKSVADSIADSARQAVQALGRQPVLATIGFDEPRWQQYAVSLARSAEKYGCRTENIVCDDGLSPNLFFDKVAECCARCDVDGVLLQQPLPIEYAKAVEYLSTDKDVDCLSPLSVFKFYSGQCGFRPATPTAALRLLEHYGYDLYGKNVAIIGRGTVGKPLALMAIQKNATVTVCHTKTQNLAQVCNRADIVISACGVSGLVKPSFVTSQTIVVDVGLSFDNGKACGDVAAEVYDVCKAVSPVPGGVGPVTRAVLFEQLIQKLAFNDNYCNTTE